MARTALALPAPVAPETSAAEEDAYRRLLQSDPDELGAQAQKGDLDALHALGMRYILYGTEDPQNNERGAALLRQAAEAGHVQAQLDYAGWFSLQKTMSNPANARARQSYRTQMIFWLEKAGENPAATPGQQSAAWTALGNAWENENSPTGKENAAYWYQRCVNSGFAGSEAALGSLYAKTAASNAHDRQAAQLWLSRAFRKGNNSVLYRLGMLYTIHPEATDRAKACFWLHLAVKEAFAQRNTAEANQAKDAREQTANPTPARGGAETQSEPRFGTPSPSAEDTPATKKPKSVREFLRERTALKKREDKQPDRAEPDTKKSPQKQIQHQPPQRTAKKKSKKERG